MSDHPLNEYEFELKEVCNTTTHDLELFEAARRAADEAAEMRKEQRKAATENPAGAAQNQAPALKTLDSQQIEIINKLTKLATLRFGGLITKVDHLVSRSNNQYGMVTIEDYAGSYKLPLFGEQYKEFASFIQPNMYVYFTAKVQERGEGRPYFKAKPEGEKQWELVILTANQLPEVKDKLVRSLTLSVPVSQLHDYMIDELQQYSESNKGNVSLNFDIHDDIYQNHVVMGSALFRIKITRQLYELLQELKDENSVDFRAELY